MTRNHNELRPVFISLKVAVAELKELSSRESFIPVSLSDNEKKKRAQDVFTTQFLKLALRTPKFHKDAMELTRLYKKIMA